MIDQCGEGLFHCKAERMCIPNKWRCDHNPDCSDEADEIGCSKFILDT